MISPLRISALLLFIAAPVDAQIARRAPRTAEPSVWLGLGAGIFNGNGINDGRTGSRWDFGQGTSWQYRASLEKAIQNQTAVGLTATYANIPITYSSTTVSPVSCLQCDASLDMVSLSLSFHAGGGTGFHQVLEGAAGATHFRNLKRDGGGELAPVEGNTDFSLTFGYGFGYSFNPAAKVYLVQDYGLVLHERDGLSNSDSNTLTTRQTRVGFRFGAGTLKRSR